MRFLFSLTLKLFYRRIFVSGLENIPKNQKIILASNHPNTFMDAFIVGVFTTGKMSTLVRSDVFSNPITSWLLELFRLIPVYRSQEGAKNLYKNEKSFHRAVLQLKKGSQILIFSEGTSIQSRNVMKLKKGTARLAFKAQEILQEDVWVVPVGINYTHFTLFRKEVMLDFGEPVKTSSFPKQTQDNNSHLTKLTHQVYLGMKKCLLVEENRAHEVLLDSLLDLKRNELSFPFIQRIFYQRHRLTLEQTWLTKFQDKLTQEDGFDQKKQAVEHYLKALAPFGLRDIKSQKISGNRPNIWILVILASPFYMVGSFAHLCTFFIARFIAQKTFKDNEYYTGVWLSATMILFLVYNTILCYHISLIYFIACNLVLVFSSFTKYYLDELWDEYNTHKKIEHLKKDSSQYLRIYEQRKHVLSGI